MMLLCSVCDEVAPAEFDKLGEGIRFDCPQCGSYSISDISSLAMPRFKPAMRRNILRLAAHRAGSTGVPHISHVD